MGLHWEQIYSKTEANATFAHICLSLSKSTDRFYTTFVAHSNGVKCHICLRFSLLYSYEFSLHLPMEQMRMQMCFFETCLHTRQINEHICFFAQRLLPM